MHRFLSQPVTQASALRIVALAIGILGSVVIARLGGAEVKGVASAFAASNALVFAFINFDIPFQALRRGRAVGELGAVGPVLARAWALYVVVGSAIAIVLLALTLPGTWLVIGAVAFLLGAQAAVAATGLHGPVVGAWGAAIQQAGILAGSLILAMADLLTVDSVLYVIVASYLAPMAYYAKYLMSDGGALGPHGFRQLGHLVWSGLAWQVARIPQMLLQKVDTVVVFLALGSSVAGIYSVGLSLAMLCTIVPAQFASSGLHEATRGRSKNPARQSTLAAYSGVFAAAILAAAGAPAIEFMYGTEFVDAYPVMLACLGGACAFGIMQVQSNYIRILGAAHHLLLINSLGLVCMIGGFFLLIPALGAVGAGLSFSIGGIAAASVTIILRRKFFAA